MISGIARNALDRATRFVLIASVAASCVIPATKKFVDVPARQTSQRFSAIRADGDVLLVSVVPTPPWFVQELRAYVIEGDVYLDAIHTSSWTGTTQFSVDLSGPEYPRDWRERLYWIETEFIPSPVNPFAEQVHELQRRKLEVGGASPQ